jgi:hypothetical protein
MSMSVATSSRPAAAVSPACAQVPEAAAWLALAALLLVAVPLFLCMPLTYDVFFYDACGQTVLRGDPLEKEMLFLPPPGMAWSLAVERALLGGSRLAVRIADLLVVATIVWLLCRWLRVVGLSRAGCVWTAVALCGLYLSTSEWVHAQPDVWMLAPATTALVLRRGAAAAAAGGVRRRVGWSLLEGLLWGSACLFKPHVFVPGLLTWLASAALARRSGPGWPRRLVPDAAGLLAGGLLMGALWQGSLLAHGTWHIYWNNVAEFRSDFYNQMPTWRNRPFDPVTKVEPWGVLHLPALVIAVAACLRGLGPGTAALKPGDRSAALLGAFYLGWFAEAYFLQSHFLYHFAPALMLALVVVAGWMGRWRRPAWGWAVVLGFVAVAVAWQPAFRPDRLALWGRCWREGASPEMKDRLAMYPGTPNWTDLARVADYLRRQQAADRDVLCYGGGTLPLYHELGLRPPTRFFFPTFSELLFRDHTAAIRAELRAGPQRYIVTDLGESPLTPAEIAGEWPGDPPEPPPGVRARLAGRWPYGEPVVFRAGRYCVHRVSSAGTQAGAGPGSAR